MKSKAIPDKTPSAIVMICGVLVTAFILLIMNKDYPLVGHDYRYFIPRLLDTELHIQNNGWSIQWYTPSFGGGLPAFPNPQHMEYSFVQWLTRMVNPWVAILLSTAVFSLLGYYFFFKFLHEKLDLNWKASTLAAVFFIGNGFYIEHMIAGLIGYQLFPLEAVILYFLIEERYPYFYNATILAITVALIMHQAGFYLIIIFILSFSMALPILFFYKASLIHTRRMIQTSIVAFILSVLMISSKVFATYSFMRFFPRLISDTYKAGILQGLLGMVSQLFGVMSFHPLLAITGQDPEFISGALSNLTGTEYGIWETDIALSPVLIVFLMIGLAHAVSTLGRNIKSIFNRQALFKFILMMVPVWVTIEMCLAKGIIYSITKQLPLLQSLHVNIRFTSAFILPLIIVGAIQLQRFFLARPKPIYFWVSALLTCLSLTPYFSLSNVVYESDFSVNASNEIYEDIQRGVSSPVTDITDSAIARWNGFDEDSSIYRPYEPIFGYELEAFKPDVHPGKILDSSDGYFNMTNPASLVFPEINGLHLFERIQVNERDKLEAFLERRQPEWKLPLVQEILNWISSLTVIFSSGILLFTQIVRRNQRVYNKAPQQIR